MADHKIYMDGEVPQLGHKRPFYFDVLEGNPFFLASLDDRVRIQSLG